MSSTIIYIFTTCVFISLVASAPSDCRARYENWFDNSKALGAFGFTLQNNSDTLLLYSYGNILYSPPPFDYYTNTNSFITYSDAGTVSEGAPTFTQAEPPFLFFDSRSLIIKRDGLISISSIGQMGSAVEFQVTCDGDVFTGKSTTSGNLYVLQFHTPIADSSSSSNPTSSPSTPSGTVRPVDPISECKATVVPKERTGATWTEGEDAYTVYDLVITNTGSARISSLSVDLLFEGGATATSSWNMDLSSSLSSSFSTYSISLNNDFNRGVVLNNYAGLIAKNGAVTVESINAVCA